MKLAMLLILALAVPSGATPYFRIPFVNGNKPVAVVGVCADPVNVGHSEQCTMLGILTHSQKDGHIFIPGEDWTLLAIGYAASGTGAKLVIGPSWNVSPLMQSLGGKAVDLLFPDSQLAADLRTFTKSAWGEHLSGSFGPAFAYDPMAGPGGHGYFRLFAGAVWQF